MRIYAKHFLPFLLFFGIWGFAIAGSEVPVNEVFRVKKHGVSFRYPSSFKHVSGRGIWSETKWRDSKQELLLIFNVTWNKDLKFFSLERALDIYFSHYRSVNLNSNIYLEDDPVKFPLASRIDALSFKAIDNEFCYRGIYLVANNREYMLLLRCGAKKKNDSSFENVWSVLKKSFSVELLSDYREYVKQMITEQEFVTESNVKEMLDYAQQLMSGKEAYIINYPKAIEEIRKALNIMENLSTRPHYNRALRQLIIAKELQGKAYEMHEKLFLQSVRLKEWKGALKEAKAIYKLMSDDRENPKALKFRNLIKEVRKQIK